MTARVRDDMRNKRGTRGKVRLNHSDTFRLAITDNAALNIDSQVVVLKLDTMIRVHVLCHLCYKLPPPASSAP